MVEASTPDKAPAPRYRRFRVRYPGVVLDSVWGLEGGGTLQAVQIEHPLAEVEADEETRIATP